MSRKYINRLMKLNKNIKLNLSNYNKRLLKTNKFMTSNYKE